MDDDDDEVFDVPIDRVLEPPPVLPSSGPPAADDAAADAFEMVAAAARESKKLGQKKRSKEQGENREKLWARARAADDAVGIEEEGGRSVASPMSRRLWPAEARRRRRPRPRPRPERRSRHQVWGLKLGALLTTVTREKTPTGRIRRRLGRWRTPDRRSTESECAEVVRLVRLRACGSALYSS